jgi:hypothetical protein
MRHAYDVSHLYDESGSAKARRYEVLRAADGRRLANELRRPGQGLHYWALAGLGDVLAALGSKIPRGSGAKALACSDC